jgi:SAM-dependent methyltransferase
MDIVDLREFYGGPLGAATRRLVGHHLRTRFKGVRGATVLGLGYALPYLDGWRDEAERIVAFMPARQGVARWPQQGLGLTALVDDTDLPLGDGSIDVALVVHELELTEPHAMLRELWRVLAPEGRVIFVVPNRRGMWARFDSTPFGHGRPFSRQQLNRMLHDQLFSPLQWANALFVPPFDRRFLVRSATAWERLGLSLSPGFAGVLMVEAIKEIYALSSTKRQRKFAKLRPHIAVPSLRRELARARTPARAAISAVSSQPSCPARQ